MDEEAQKRNTDCVYFLASPLTCKKGNGCEFRHSEAARMNPRDCWYWVHKTCLNPNCAFRHPPLDGKPSSSVPSQTQTVASAVVNSSAAATLAVSLSSKSKTPCYFFSQGNCAKGDKCPFMHSLSTPTSQEVTTEQNSKSRPNEAEQASSKLILELKGEPEKLATFQLSEKRRVVQNESNSTPLRSLIIPAQETPQTVQDGKKTRVPEASVPMQEAPQEIKDVRRASLHEQVTHGNRKPRITKFSDTPEDYQDAVGRFHDKHSLAEMSQQDQPKRKKQQLSHLENEHSQRSRTLYRSSSSSEARWKNELSGLEGAESDQSNHKEDTEFSPNLGSRGLDDSRRARFKSLIRNDQAGSYQHTDYGNRHPRQQQMRPLREYNDSIEHSRHLSFASNAGNSIRDGRRMVPEGYTYNVDLRDQLMKRQRDERGLLTRSEIARRGNPDDKAHLNQRLWDDNHRNRTQHDRAKRPDGRGVKRPFHDGEFSPNRHSQHMSPVSGSQRLGRSPDRASAHDHARGEPRDIRREQYASEMAVTSSKKVGSEFANDDACFAAPKTLAQIKAEKLALNPNSQLGRSQPTTVSGKMERAFDHKSALSTDFEGPKPLSLLRKEKQNMVPVSKREESRAGPEEIGDDLEREVEDGEVRDEEDDWNQEPPVLPMQEEVVASRLPSDLKTGLPLKEAHGFREADEAQDDELASSEDLSRLEEDLGPIMSGEEDYELDEVDEENFAKNLNSYFS